MYLNKPSKKKRSSLVTQLRSPTLTSNENYLIDNVTQRQRDMESTITNRLRSIHPFVVAARSKGFTVKANKTSQKTADLMKFFTYMENKDGDLDVFIDPHKNGEFWHGKLFLDTMVSAQQLRQELLLFFSNRLSKLVEMLNITKMPDYYIFEAFLYPKSTRSIAIRTKRYTDFDKLPEQSNVNSQHTKITMKLINARRQAAALDIILGDLMQFGNRDSTPLPVLNEDGREFAYFSETYRAFVDNREAAKEILEDMENMLQGRLYMNGEGYVVEYEADFNKVNYHEWSNGWRRAWEQMQAAYGLSDQMIREMDQAKRDNRWRYTSAYFSGTQIYLNVQPAIKNWSRAEDD